MKRPEAESITVLVFKDNFAARSFQLPIAWVSRFGLIVGALSGVTLLTAGAALRFYWLARKADPVRVMDLEQEVADLREALARKALVASTPSVLPSTLPSLAPSAVPSLASTQTPAAPSTPLVQQTPAAPVVAPAAPAAPATPAAGTVLGGELTSAAPVPAQELTFKADPIRAKWKKGGGLEVTFNLIYTRNDGASQRGRVLVLARGPSVNSGYPAGTLVEASGKWELRPREGEYFSVGRFREVVADFPELSTKSGVTTVEVLIFDTSLKLLVHQVKRLSEVSSQ